MSVDGKEKIVLGSGKLFIMEFDSAVGIPEDGVIEKDINQAGLIQGGANLEYKPTFYTAKDDLGLKSKTIITEEEATLKSGIMTWNGSTLKRLCSTARVVEDKVKGKRTVKIGGTGNQDGKNYLIRFLHEDAADGDIRVTVVGRNEAGFTIAFAKDKETVIDAEFKAQPHDSEGTLIHYTEDIPKIEISKLKVESVEGTTLGNTIITVTPTLSNGNSYVYKLDTKAININYQDDCSKLNTWNGIDEIGASTGDIIAIVEINSNGLAQAFGTTTVAAKA